MVPVTTNQKCFQPLSWWFIGLRHHLQLVAETPSRQTEGTVRDAVGRVQKQPHGWSHSEKDLPLGWAVVGWMVQVSPRKIGFQLSPIITGYEYVYIRIYIYVYIYMYIYNVSLCIANHVIWGWVKIINPKIRWYDDHPTGQAVWQETPTCLCLKHNSYPVESNVFCPNLWFCWFLLVKLTLLSQWSSPHYSNFLQKNPVQVLPTPAPPAPPAPPEARSSAWDSPCARVRTKWRHPRSAPPAPPSPDRLGARLDG